MPAWPRSFQATLCKSVDGMAEFPAGSIFTLKEEKMKIEVHKKAPVKTLAVILTAGIVGFLTLIIVSVGG